MSLPAKSVKAGGGVEITGWRGQTSFSTLHPQLQYPKCGAGETLGTEQHVFNYCRTRHHKDGSVRAVLQKVAAGTCNSKEEPPNLKDCKNFILAQITNAE